MGTMHRGREARNPASLLLLAAGLITVRWDGGFDAQHHLPPLPSCS